MLKIIRWLNYQSILKLIKEQLVLVLLDGMLEKILFERESLHMLIRRSLEITLKDRLEYLLSQFATSLVPVAANLQEGCGYFLELHLFSGALFHWRKWLL